MTEDATGPAALAGALDKGLAILKHLADSQPASTADLAKALRLSRSTTYRLMDRLSDAGFVSADRLTGVWQLGAEAARLGVAAVQSADLTHVAPELLRTLTEQARETVGLSVYNAGQMVFVYRERSPQEVVLHAELGARRPMHCTSVGKAYLAALPSEQAEVILHQLHYRRFTAETIVSISALRTEIHTIRKRGWSTDLREFSPEIACVGAAVRDRTGMPVGAISAAGPAHRVLPIADKIGPVVASTADAISRRLGYFD